LSVPHPDLVCSDLTKDFDAFRAVDRVSLEVPQGSLFSILGPSGCGKTTLLRMIAGFQSPTSGDLRIKGKSMIGVPPNKRPVSMVFQHLALFPTMNIGDNVGFGLRPPSQRSTGAWNRCLNVLAYPVYPNGGLTRYRVVKSNVSPLHAVWFWSRMSYCWMSRWARWT
jgi:spermidine/putrescine transport system ATP-binding protein